MKRNWYVTIGCLIGMVLPLMAGDAPPQKPAVAIFSNLAPPRPIEDYFRSKGWQTLFVQWGQSFSNEFFRQFNVVIVSSYPQIDPKAPYNHELHVKPEYEESTRKLLWQYVEDGGGLLVYGGEFPIIREPLNGFLKRWNIEMLNEQVLDPGHYFKQRQGMQYEYLYTSKMADHPVIKNIKCVFYPLRSLYGAGHYPLKLGDEWQWLVQGTDQAKSFPLVANQNYTVPDEKQNGHYAQCPPLAASRQAGKGRIVAFGWSPIQTFFEYQHYMVEDIYFKRGGDGKPSDGMALLEQTLAWLAEPSLAMTNYGGYVSQPTRVPVKFPEPLKWKTVKFETMGLPDPAKRWYKGIMGARTQLTGGTGSVKEYAEAARAAKLDFIAFMEDFGSLTRDSWTKFRKECAESTGADLLVLPGQAVQRGQAGDWYFKISDYDWPQPDMLTADGKRLNNYLYEHFQSGLNTLGPYDIRNEPSPYWVSRAYNSMAVMTTRNGKTEIDLEPFLYQTSLQDDPRPVAIDLITAPSQVAEAAGRFLNYRFCRNQEELKNALKNPDSYGHSAQVSSGPLITVWQGVNQWPATYGKIVPGVERVLVRLKAESDQPLAEAMIYDNTHLYRRFQLSSNTCDLAIHTLHDRQHQFTAVVKDVRGRMAIRSLMGAIDLYNRRFMCSDRQNSLSQTCETDANGFDTRVAACCMQNKLMTGAWFGYPANPQTVGRVSALLGWMPGGYVSGGVEPVMYMSPLISPQPSNTYQCLVGRMEFPMGAHDVLCQAIGTEYVMPDFPWSESGHFWPMRPNPKYQAYTRCYEFKKTINGPAASLIEGYYVMKEDGQWEPHEWYWHVFSHIFFHMGGQPGPDCGWAFVNPGSNEFLSGVVPPVESAANYIKQLSPGGYIAYYTAHETAAVFPLDEPLQVVQELHDRNWFRAWIGYGRLGQAYKKGDKIPFRFVVLTGSIATPGDTREIESFWKSFGLHGGKPLYEVTPRIGAVRSTAYVLELDAKNGGFGGLVNKAALPALLPIRVHGLNPNWSCGLVERKEKWWRPIGVLDDSGYVALNTAVEHDLWIGHLVQCDRPELLLTFLPDGEGGFAIEAHNSTTTDITAVVQTSPEFTLVSPFSSPVTVKAGSSVMLESPAPAVPSEKTK